MAWTRRKFIKAGVAGLTGFLFLDALWIEKFFIETNHFFPGSDPTKKEDFSIVQISDLHLQSVGYPLRKLAEKINHLQPDLIAITGDSVDDAKHLYLLNRFLNLLDHQIRKVAIVGNWEYWSRVNFEDLAAVYKNNNCDLLINANQQYTFRDKTILVTGVDDLLGGKPDIDIALLNAKQSDYHLVLNHCPKYTDEIMKKNLMQKADLILSGHTHGGQINLFGFAPFLPQGCGKYLKGWYENMYVSKGIGTSILPIRFLARAEIAVFHISLPA